MEGNLVTACPQLDLTLWFIFMCKLYVIGICVKDTKYASYVIRAIRAPRPYGRGGPQQCPQDTGSWNPSPGQPLIFADRSLDQACIVQPEKRQSHNGVRLVAWIRQEKLGERAGLSRQGREDVGEEKEQQVSWQTT